MITKENINITRVETFRNVIEYLISDTPQHYFSHIEIDFLLFDTIKCNIEYREQLNSFEEIKDVIINLFNLKTK